MINFLRNIRRGIGNIICWFPVIWKDRHWDCYFIMLVTHHKLADAYKRQRWAEIFEIGDWAANYLRIARDIARKYLDCEYETFAEEEHQWRLVFKIIAKRGQWWWD
jgi:hypothetical protein